MWGDSRSVWRGDEGRGGEGGVVRGALCQVLQLDVSPLVCGAAVDLRMEEGIGEEKGGGPQKFRYLKVR